MQAQFGFGITGAQLKQARETSGLSSKIFAEILGISREFYWRIENGIKPVPRSVQKRWDAIRTAILSCEPVVDQVLTNPSTNLLTKCEPSVNHSESPTVKVKRPRAPTTRAERVELLRSQAKVKFDFLRVWKDYPRHKGGKGNGEILFYQQIKTEKDYNDLLRALAAYKEYLRSVKTTEEQFMMLFQTFMGGEKWRDWLKGDSGVELPMSGSEFHQRRQDKARREGKSYTLENWEWMEYQRLDRVRALIAEGKPVPDFLLQSHVPENERDNPAEPGPVEKIQLTLVG